MRMFAYASGIGGANPHCGEGPLVLPIQWDAVFAPASSIPALEVKRMTEALAVKTEECIQKKEFFIVVGGDHTSAMGTWRGVAKGLFGPLGLIWIDAHMDSHTLETSLSQRLHGMPLASLLGYGDKASIDPENLCLIGVRSYEEGEAALLKKLKVRIYFMEEVKERGLAVVFKEALQKITKNTVAYGISVDIDSIDPSEAPGVDVPESDGLLPKELIPLLKEVSTDPRLIGAEIVEFDPTQDQEQKTQKLVMQLIESLKNV